MNKASLSLATAGAITLAIILLSTGNGVQLPSTWHLFEGVDKLQHAFAYFVAAVSWLFAFRQNRSHESTWRSEFANTSPQRLWSFLFLLGTALELCQWAFYPNRYFEFADMLANGAGAGIGAYGFKRIFPS